MWENVYEPTVGNIFNVAGKHNFNTTQNSAKGKD